MGPGLSKFPPHLHEKQQVTLLMVGLDGAGKTTAVHRLKHGTFDSTLAATPSFNVESFDISGARLIVWEVGGREETRARWPQFTGAAHQGVVFVIDSADHARVSLACDAFLSLCHECPLSELPVLVLCNKQDLAGALDAPEVACRLTEGAGRPIWKSLQVQPCSAKNGAGLWEGVDWLYWKVSEASL